MSDYVGPILNVAAVVTGNIYVQIAAVAWNPYGSSTADPKKLPTIQSQQDQEHADERA